MFIYSLRTSTLTSFNREDAATAEVSRSQLWQWARHGVTTAEGKRVDKAYALKLLKESADELSSKAGKGNKYHLAAQYFAGQVTGEDYADFLTRYVFHHLEFQPANILLTCELAFSTTKSLLPAPPPPPRSCKSTCIRRLPIATALTRTGFRQMYTCYDFLGTDFFFHAMDYGILCFTCDLELDNPRLGSELKAVVALN